MSLQPTFGPEVRQSIPNLIRQLFTDLSELIQQHIELTKTEVREEGERFVKAAIFGVAGLIFLQITLIFIGYISLILFMLIGGFNILAATIATTIILLVLTAAFLAICAGQIRSAQNILKQQRKTTLKRSYRRVVMEQK